MFKRILDKKPDRQPPTQPDPFSTRQARSLERSLAGWYLQDSCQLCPGIVIAPDDVVADIGCGNGEVSEFVAKIGARVIAVDMNEDALNKARKRLERHARNEFQVIHNHGDTLPLEDGVASVVVCREVLEHVDCPEAIMRELLRIGTSDARYLLSVPDPVAEGVQRTLAPPSYWRKPNHIRVFERDEFDDLIRAAGLVIVHKQYDSFYWSMWWILFWAADQNVGEEEGPLLKLWTRTWNELITSPKGADVRKALNDFMPKSQLVVARKAA